MIVYVVIRSVTHRFDNDSCWDDGWYDDYYEDEVESQEVVGVCLTEELAKELVEQEESKLGAEDYVYYVPYNVIDSR